MCFTYYNFKNTKIKVLNNNEIDYKNTNIFHNNREHNILFLMDSI